MKERQGFLCEEFKDVCISNMFLEQNNKKANYLHEKWILSKDIH